MRLCWILLFLLPGGCAVPFAKSEQRTYRGTVFIERTQTPARGASVRVHRIERGLLMPNSHRVDSTVTDAHGRFTISNVLPGDGVYADLRGGRYSGGVQIKRSTVAPLRIPLHRNTGFSVLYARHVDPRRYKKVTRRVAPAIEKIIRHSEEAGADALLSLDEYARKGVITSEEYSAFHANLEIFSPTDRSVTVLNGDRYFVIKNTSSPILLVAAGSETEILS